MALIRKTKFFVKYTAKEEIVLNCYRTALAKALSPYLSQNISDYLFRFLKHVNFNTWLILRSRYISSTDSNTRSSLHNVKTGGDSDGHLTKQNSGQLTRHYNTQYIHI